MRHAAGHHCRSLESHGSVVAQSYFVRAIATMELRFLWKTCNPSRNVNPSILRTINSNFWGLKTRKTFRLKTLKQKSIVYCFKNRRNQLTSALPFSYKLIVRMLIPANEMSLSCDRLWHQRQRCSSSNKCCYCKN